MSLTFILKIRDYFVIINVKINKKLYNKTTHLNLKGKTLNQHAVGKVFDS